MMFTGKKFTTRGHLVIETLGIMTVITLLVAVAVPSYWNQSSTAQIAQAKADIQELAQAQLNAAEQYGYYLPLQLLDNASETRSERTDSIANESETIALVDPSGDLETQAESPQLLAGGAAHPLAAWSGPLAQVKRVYLAGQGDSFDVASLDPSALRRDYPVDPWGNPYRFYSPMGLIGTRAGESTIEARDSDGFSDGRLTSTDDRFDTFAIVSFGPDGQSDAATDTDDDLIFLLGEQPEAQ